jgi:hypothetical protein
MSQKIFSAILCACAALAPIAVAKPANLLVHTDVDCKLSIDGKAKGIVTTHSPLRVSLPAGEHKLEAVDIVSGARWADTLKANGQAGQEFAIPLRAAVTREELKKGYWTDPDTGLMWAAADNGSAIIYTRADFYCRNLTLGGFKDWTLPAIEDLSKLFGGPANAGGFHTATPIKLTGWEWSSTTGKEPGEQWALDFGDGGRASAVTGDSGFNRALCVRRAKSGRLCSSRRFCSAP